MNFVVEYAGCITALRNAWHVEDQDTACIVVGDIVVDVGADGVLNLYAGNVVFSAVVANYHLFGLAHVNASIGSGNSDIPFQ